MGRKGWIGRNGGMARKGGRGSDLVISAVG